MKIPNFLLVSLGLSLPFLLMPIGAAAYQTTPGVGNAAAISLSQKSPLVQSARQFLIQQAKQISNVSLRNATFDAIANSKTCVKHRAGVTDSQKRTILQKLVRAGLVNLADNSTFPGGLIAGVFPPLLQDGSACPQLPQTFFSAPGSSFGGHHSYPGGLVIHEAFNELSDLSFASNYQRVYGQSRQDGLPVINPDRTSQEPSDIYLSNDLIVAAPI